ncbi:MAG TPA: prepilin-type N-terminal cleavage/methylation domain-containing protein [Gemmatimonadales bacterium]|nr:prepilin-type N-terminal cleavage/methylation domain-containing protein [Gemmatimonadales bacterium]
MSGERGFTITEVLVGVMVLSVGVTGLATTAALTTRMIARGERSATAMMFAQRRLERLRLTACTTQAAGADTLYRGGVAAINSWTFTNAGNRTWRIVLTSTYTTYRVKRAERLETEISCLF